MMIFQILKGTERYNHKEYLLAGQLFASDSGELRFYPVCVLNTYRQNSWGTNHANILDVSKEQLDRAESELNQLVTLTADVVSSIISARYRQAMTLNRDTAQDLINTGIELFSGRTMTKIEASKALCDYSLESRKENNGSWVKDNWKIRSTYEAIANLL